MITAPGVYDIPEAEYHAEPVEGGSLSASGAKLLWECPAKYHHRQGAGEEHKDVFDFGKAAHGLVLGVGAPVVVLEFDSYKSKAAQDAKADAYAEGVTPVLEKDWAKVTAMATAIRDHELASALLRQPGRPEATVVWHDLIWRRARFDYLPDPPGQGETRTPVIVDYKTTPDASPDGFAKSVANYGYSQQVDWYRAGYRATFGIDAPFVLIAQEKEPPYLIGVYQLTSSFEAIGAWRNEVAVRRYQHGMATGQWPGYSTNVELLQPPRWLEYQHEEEREMHNEGALT